jgi:hypothetical protein
MQLEGAMRVFRLRNVVKHEGDSLVDQDTEDLEVVFDLPFIIGSDHAEGMALFSCLGYPDALLIVYEAPDAARQVKPHRVFADVFRLP